MFIYNCFVLPLFGLEIYDLPAYKNDWGSKFYETTCLRLAFSSN